MRIRTLLHLLFVGAVLALAVVLRADRLASPDFFTDEAESTTNALGILAHGLPVDHVQGLPIFESPLTQRWPEHPEYEFRETNYSSRGVSLAHGWIPLYAIAASLSLGGIEPCAPAAPLQVRRTEREMRDISRLARLPSVVFALLFAGFLYLAGRSLFDRAVGRVAFLLGALAAPLVVITTQARYYAATLAFATLAALALWRFLRRPGVRRAVLLGLAFALLFFTHLSACLVTSLLAVSCLPSVVRKPRGLLLAALAAGVFALPAGAWSAWFGLSEGLGWTPLALPHLELFDFLPRTPRTWGWTLLLGGHALAVAGLACGGRLGARGWPGLFAHSFLARWVLAGVVCVYTHPLIALFWSRVFWALIPPAILLCAALLVAVVPRRWRGGGWSAVGLAGLLLLTTSGGELLYAADAPRDPEVAQVVERLRGRVFEEGTRFYANAHFTLGVYTGLPFQALGPVRASFLAAHPGPIVYVEYDPLAVFVDTAWVGHASHAHGLSPSGAELEDWTRRLEAELPRRRVRQLGAVPDRAAPLPPALEPLREPFFARHGAWTRALAEAFAPVFRGQPEGNLFLVYMYRFVDPAARLGAHLNLRARLEGARATIVTPRWVIYTCAGLEDGP